MIGERATLNGIPGTGWMEVAQAGALKGALGAFSCAPEDESKLFDLMNSKDHGEFEGVIWEAGEGRRMRIKVVLSRMQIGSCRVQLVGSGAPYE